MTTGSGYSARGPGSICPASAPTSYPFPDLPDVKISAMDGPISEGRPCGYMAEMRPSSLGIKQAVYFPDLDVTRLLSTQLLVRDGWRLELAYGRSRLSHPTRGVVEVDDSQELPQIEFKIGVGSNIAAAARGYSNLELPQIEF